MNSSNTPWFGSWRLGAASFALAAAVVCGGVMSPGSDALAQNKPRSGRQAKAKEKAAKAAAAAGEAAAAAAAAAASEGASLRQGLESNANSKGSKASGGAPAAPSGAAAAPAGTAPAASGFGSALGAFATQVQGVVNPEISVILAGAAGWFTEGTPLQAGAHDPRRRGFTLQGLELALGAAADPYFRVDVTMVFGVFGVELEEAYATTLGLPYSLQLRAGQLLLPFGRLSAQHLHARDFVDQPLFLGKFWGSEGNRALGAEISWLAPLPWTVQLYGLITEASGDCCQRSFRNDDAGATRDPGDWLYTTVAKQFFELHPDWALQWGLSAQFGSNPTSVTNRSFMLGTDVLLRFRPVGSPNRTQVTMLTETVWRQRQVPLDTLDDWGLNTQVVWRIRPRWEAGVRYELLTGVDGDYLDPEQTRARHRASLLAMFRATEYSRLRVQLSYDDPRWLKDAIWAAVFALEIGIGAHAAHVY